MKRPDDPRRYAVRPGIAHREINGRLLLLLPGDTRLYTFNDTGRLVWRALLRRRDTGAIAASIARTFAIPVAQARRDVDELLTGLLRRGVIEEIHHKDTKTRSRAAGRRGSSQ